MAKGRLLGLSALFLTGVLAACGSAGMGEAGNPAAAERFPVDTQVLEVDRGRLFVRQRSVPTAQVALVAIHGGPGMQSDYLWELDRLVGEKLSFVTYDQHGAGRSQPSDPVMTMESYTAELEQVIESSAHPRAILFGHSWGALVAVNYAAEHPDRVIGLILMGPAPLTFQQLTEGARQFQARVERLVAEGLLSVPMNPNNPSDLLPTYFADPTFKAPESLTGISYSTAANTLTWQALGDYDFVEQASMIGAPAMVLWGDKDPFGSEWGRSVARSIGEAGSQFVLLEECGHYWHECPEQFYGEVERFLEQVGVR